MTGQSKDSQLPETNQIVSGQYQIVRVLGEGAFGITYLATDLRRREFAVLKIVRLQDEPGAQRLQKEAQALARIRHPNIAGILNNGRLEDGRPYLVLQWVEGASLKAVLRQGTLPLAQALLVIRALAEALAVVHDAGLIHRDLKPSNVIIPQRGPSLVFAEAKLIDFGVFGELVQKSALQQNVTMAGEFFGTPYYMAPEQWRAEPQSPATDVYGLGVLLYEMLFGRPPFHAENATTFLIKAAREEIAIPAAPALPESVRTLLSQALDKKPGSRPPSARAVLAALDRVVLWSEQNTSVLPPHSEPAGEYFEAPVLRSPQGPGP